ncbi:hypothetical protein BDB00DRAFT_866877 [Zychaea mexicana]|uniref:uncharacterized protein n=1 Tax=Zychaea mexicana TaxID=64656 RepID=UPI0022FF3813|nr:uncharacterized protein BDB00DRAFT_866877 [Zychaea mexicana]KAI9499397.1 hypothetical protein BDB00DRAFT_866877 [Zychaea mexicana]
MVDTNESTPEKELLALIQSGNPVKEIEIAALFEKLKPLDAESLTGSWRPGPYVETGHPGVQQLKEAKFDGKDFYSEDNVQPVMCLNDKGERVFNEQYGYASLRKVEYRGVLSTAMIYDTHPIIDHFRYLTDDYVFGAMDTKMFPKEAGMLYFCLKKAKL